MWLTPQKIKDNSLITSNKAYVLYLPDTFPYFFKTFLFISLF